MSVRHLCHHALARRGPAMRALHGCRGAEFIEKHELIHANVGWRFGPLRYVLATPQYHHWHHSADKIDVNFAVHLPVIDAVFGTFYLPGSRWPSAYGIHGNPVPEGYWAQLALPFRRSSTAG